MAERHSRAPDQRERILDLSLSPLDLMVRKLEMWCVLSDADKAAILALPYIKRELKADQYIVWDGDRPANSCLIVSGFAFRHKLMKDGSRQIYSIHMAGDLVDLQNALLRTADHNVQSMTPCHVAMIPIEIIQKLAFDRPTVGMAMWYETLVDASIFREWISNVGRRDAKARIAHILCEFAIRMEAAGLGERGEVALPMTQEQLADAVSLTPIHVNRTLKALEDEKLISRQKRAVLIPDWRKLAAVGDFEPRYLHLNDRPTETNQSPSLRKRDEPMVIRYKN
jgi:CRP-like cAMP-binding protein